MPSFICGLHAAYAGNIQKANLQLSEILLNSYLRAAGSFCAIPLLCIGAEINHRHARRISMISLVVAKRYSHNNGIDKRVNKRRENTKFPCATGAMNPRVPRQEAPADWR
jgi:hypothetical protein